MAPALVVRFQNKGIKCDSIHHSRWKCVKIFIILWQVVAETRQRMAITHMDVYIQCLTLTSLFTFVTIVRQMLGARKLLKMFPNERIDPWIIIYRMLHEMYRS